MTAFLWGPNAWIDGKTVATITTFQLNSNAAQNSGGVAAFSIIKIKKSGTINKIEGNVTAVGGTGGTYEFGLFTVSSGVPTGTNYGGSATATGALSATGVFSVTLGTTATAVRGDLVAVVVRAASGTDYATNNVTVQSSFRIGLNGGINLPYAGTNTAGTATRVGDWPMIAPRFNDSTYGQTMPSNNGTALANTAYGSGSTPNERGAIFQVPFEGKCSGARVPVDIATLGTDTFDVNLYNADTAALLATSVIAANQQGTGSLGSLDVYWADDDATTQVSVSGGINYVTLSPTVNYRLTVKPTTAGTLRFYQWVAPNSDAKAAVPFGDLWGETSRKDALAWTDVTNTIPLFGLWFETMVTDPTVNITQEFPNYSMMD